MVNENQQAIEKDGDEISYLNSRIAIHDDSISKNKLGKGLKIFF